MFVVWNVRGFNDHVHISKACSFFARYQFSLIGLLEAKVNVANEIHSHISFLPLWKYVVACGSTSMGSIRVCWDLYQVDADVIDVDPHWVHVRVTFLDYGHSYIITFVYGLHKESPHRLLWNFLCSTSAFNRDIPCCW